jgi:hypothetical protein
MNDSQPGYKLIQAKTLETDCPVHAREFLLDLYNQANGGPLDTWKMQVVGVDKIQFRCQKCGSERVYKYIEEKTTL